MGGNVRQRTWESGSLGLVAPVVADPQIAQAVVAEIRPSRKPTPSRTALDDLIKRKRAGAR